MESYIDKKRNFFKEIIKSSINLEAYGIDNEGYLYDKVKTTYNIFKKEYGFMIERVGEVNAFKEWLQGLPSAIEVPYMYKDILNLAREGGLIQSDIPEGRDLDRAENRILEDYWINLSLSFFELKDGVHPFDV